MVLDRLRAFRLNRNNGEQSPDEAPTEPAAGVDPSEMTTELNPTEVVGTESQTELYDVEQPTDIIDAAEHPTNVVKTSPEHPTETVESEPATEQFQVINGEKRDGVETAPTDVIARSFQADIAAGRIENAIAASQRVEALSTELARQFASSLVGEDAKIDFIQDAVDTVPKGKGRDDVIDLVAQELAARGRQDDAVFMIKQMNNKPRASIRMVQIENSIRQPTPIEDFTEDTTLPGAKELINQFKEHISGGQVLKAAKLAGKMNKLSMDMKRRYAIALAQRDAPVEELDQMIWSFTDPEVRTEFTSDVIEALMTVNRFNDARTLAEQSENPYMQRVWTNRIESQRYEKVTKPQRAAFDAERARERELEKTPLVMDEEGRIISDESEMPTEQNRVA